MRDLTGKRFGRQIAISVAGKNKYGNFYWLCKCDCGNEHIVPSGKLLQGKSKSCGCLAKEIHIKQLEKHGITTGGKPRTFTIWNGMKARCYNPKSTSYKRYGKRGITICDEWIGENGFMNFHNWAMANGYDDNFEIDRIDNDGNYSPENCHWIPKHENRVKQRHTRFINAGGCCYSVSEWCKRFGISKSTAYKRLNKCESDFVTLLESRIKKRENCNETSTM